MSHVDEIAMSPCRIQGSIAPQVRILRLWWRVESYITSIDQSLVVAVFVKTTLLRVVQSDRVVQSTRPFIIYPSGE